MAAHSIQVAVSRAAAGDTIYVNGSSGTKVYTGSNVDPAGGNNVVVLTKNVTIMGVGNPIIDGGAAVRGVYITAGQMSGFTIRKGAAYDGGGAYIVGGELRNSIVVSNTSSHAGSGIFLSSAGKAVNCLIAHHNSGVYFTGGSLVNCTVVGNGIGLYMQQFASVFNCVAWSNSTNWRINVLNPAIAMTYFYHNSTTPAYSGGGEVSGNIASPPNFQNYAAGNYRLGLGTSCLNGGFSQAALGYGATDLDGNPRVVGPNIDIGAYETPLPEGPAADAYEPDDSAAAAKAIANGQTQNRTLHGPLADEDWVKFTVPSGGAQSVVIETDGPSGGDTVMWLYNGSAQQVGTDDDSGTGNFSLITASSLAAGTYYIRVIAYSGTTAYTLRTSWTESAGSTPDTYEYDGGATAAKAISNGQTQNHTMHVAGDVDWVKFTVGAAGASNVRVETSGASGDTHMWLFGPNNASTLVAYDNDTGTGNFSLITKAALAPGTYFLGIREYGDNATIAAYAVQASWTTPTVGPTPDAYEYDGSAVSAKAISNGQTQNHSIHVAGDVDWVKFTVGAAGASSVRVETSGASGDTHMWLFGPNNAGTLVAYNDDKGGGSTLSLITKATLAPGTYYLGIREYGDNATIAAYAVQVSWTTPTSSGDAYEYDGSAAAAKDISNGQTQNRSIQPMGEVDWAKFTVSVPGASNVRVETAGAAGDTQMWLFGPNSASTLVAYNDDKGSGNYFSLITAASLTPGTYYVGIREYGNDGIIPAYTLQTGWTSP